MNKQEAQLMNDYGKAAVGNIAGAAVVAPDGGFTDGKTYNLVYTESTNTFTLTEVTEAEQTQGAGGTE